MNLPVWRIAADPAAQARALAAALAAVLAEAAGRHGEACLAVSGGRSPGPLFDVLHDAALPWARIRVVLVDERLAPEESDERNEGLVRRRLLRGPAAAARFTPPLDAAGRPIRAPARIDALVLGMGADGHTASLFPDAPELAAALDPGRPPAYVFVTPPAAPWRRVTLNLAAILGADRLFVALSGGDKRAVLERALRAGRAGPPIGAVLAGAATPEIHWCP
ncbi:6-phosphogluconolactonase [Castellaniella defragrans]|uniref:6-phosphogluconolactonase n=2 Tax=Castellaniella defragrans TaxID=75697 RepID=A0A7W9TQ14_CASDE|nr:6-phosphogluconolactonase [Castellaniella defragrans]MBB6084431.1 6-phosphogluconolactonase [Castellaniella defragrans]